MIRWACLTFIDICVNFSYRKFVRGVDGGSGILEDILEEFQSHLVPLVEEFFEQSANPIYGNQDVSTLANNV